MAEPTRSGSSLVPKIVLAGIAAFVVLTIIGWIVGAVISLLRVVAVVAVIIGVIWAIAAARD